MTNWVVADAKEQVMRCDRCGDIQPMKILEGIRLDFAAKIMKAFAELHEDCVPKLFVEGHQAS